MRTYREIVQEAAEGRIKVLALEVFRTAGESAQREVRKYLDGSRGENLWRIIEAVYRLGNRDAIRRYHEQRLAPPDPAAQLAEIGEQLELFAARVVQLHETFRELAEVFPLDQRREKSRR